MKDACNIYDRLNLAICARLSKPQGWNRLGDTVSLFCSRVKVDTKKHCKTQLQEQEVLIEIIEIVFASESALFSGVQSK